MTIQLINLMELIRINLFYQMTDDIHTRISCGPTTGKEAVCWDPGPGPLVDTERRKGNLN